jgi:hypothetical protein
MAQRLQWAVLKRDKKRCTECGKASSSLHVHHILAKSHGCTDDISNVTTLCEDCHTKHHPYMICRTNGGGRLGTRKNQRKSLADRKRLGCLLIGRLPDAFLHLDEIGSSAAGVCGVLTINYTAGVNSDARFDIFRITVLAGTNSPNVSLESQAAEMSGAEDSPEASDRVALPYSRMQKPPSGK